MEVKEIDLNAEIEKLIREAQNSTSYEALTFIAEQLLNRECPPKCVNFKKVVR